jgi:outer membrane protein assembly factor BamE (lipoprotein component of BamABCDE complex)
VIVNMTLAKRAGAVLMLATALAGCSSIRNNRGYLQDALLVSSVQPGIDNRQSVERTLGRPTFASQFGEPVWYYVSSVTGQAPFTTPKIRTQAVMAIHFDEAGNVRDVQRTGIERVAFLDPWAASAASSRICSAISARSVQARLRAVPAAAVDQPPA